MSGPGSMTRYIEMKRAAAHDALRSEQDADGSTVDLRQVSRDMTDFKLDQAFADYAAAFGIERAIAKAIALCDEAQIARA